MGLPHARGALSLALVLASILLLSVVPPAAAGAEAPPPFGLRARAAILVDQATGRVLYERNADEPFLPASLAKLVSLHVVYEMLEDRSIRAHDVVSITTRAWAANQEPGSSLMYLEPGQIVTVEDLMRGTAIASGNDAATALAEYAAGSVEKFVRLMNDECRWLGYRTTRFVDPSGLSRENQVSAREFADFCRRYIEWHPQALAELHSLREFFYPLPRNLPPGSSPFLRSYRVYNPNYLVWDDFGVDGLKTGHLDNGNFTAALTAARGGTRLIAVLLGVPGHGLTDGARIRSEDGMALFAWGFRNFATVRLAVPRLDPLRVWKGSSSEVAVMPARPVEVTARAEEVDRIVSTVVASGAIVAPVAKGQKVGDLVLSADGTEVGRIPLLAAEGVASAGPLKRAWDTLRMGLNLLTLPSDSR